MRSCVTGHPFQPSLACSPQAVVLLLSCLSAVYMLFKIQEKKAEEAETLRDVGQYAAWTVAGRKRTGGKIREQ